MAAALLWGAIANATATAASAGVISVDPPRPATDGDWADPDVIRVGETFYSYATNTGGAWDRLNVPVRSSTTLADWTLEGDALPVLGSWASPGHTWAPAVVARNGRYVLYYTARHRTARTPKNGPLQCIGVATSASPTGPFVDDRGTPLVCQRELGGSIDPNTYVDTTDRAWLVWKSDENAIGATSHLYASELSADGLALVGPSSVILGQDRAWEIPLVENPALVADPSGGLYLFYSGNWWESGRYATGYARCWTPLGPCVKATLDGPWMASQVGSSGPGGVDVVTDTTGQAWIGYHTWSPGQESYASGGTRALAVRPITFVDGEPRLGRDGSSSSGDLRGPAVGIGSDGGGYTVFSASGAIRSFNATSYGDLTGSALNSPIVGGGRTPSGNGYWAVGRDGGVFAFGDAGFYGSTGDIALNQPIVGFAPTPSGRGYWFVARDGGVFAFGDAGFYGSMAASPLNQPIVGMAASPSGQGYWLIARDGGVFAFGDAGFYGSTGDIPLNQPIVGFASTPSGRGYWFVARDGGVFAYGDAAFRGSLAGAIPADVTGIAATAAGQGYWLVAASGQTFAFGDAGFFGEP